MVNSSFTVAMSVYDKDNPAFLDRALQSITAQQSIIPNEIILVCDGQLGDKLNETVTRYEKELGILRVIRLSQNGGLGNALNVAVSKASNDLIARMDSDDISLPTRFEQQLSFFHSHPEIDIVGGDISEFIDTEDNIVGRRCVPCDSNGIKNYMKKRSPFNHVSVMFKKQAIEQAGGYLDCFWNEDYYLWIRMQLQGATFANTGTTLVNVRIGKEMYQRRGGKKYFQSELKLQKLMLHNKMINRFTFVVNVVERFIVQLLLPSKIRGWVFRRFARTK